MDDVYCWHVGVQDFDDVFQGSEGTLNSLITINNNVIMAENRIKEASAALFGAFQLSVKVDNNNVIATVVNDENKALDEKELEDVKGKNPDVAGALTEMNAQIQELNGCGAFGVVFRESRGRIMADRSKVEDEGKAELANKMLIGSNNSMFVVKAALMVACAKDSMDPMKALNEIIANIKREAKEGFNPRVRIDTSGIAEGKIDLDVSLGDFDTNVWPRKLKKAYDAIFSDDESEPGLIKCIMDTVQTLGELMPQLEEMKTNVEKLPNEPGELKDCAVNAGLSPGKAMAFPKRVAENAKELTRAPEIVATLNATIKKLLDDLRTAIEQAQGVAKEL
jgi:hypothetical protein